MSEHGRANIQLHQPLTHKLLHLEVPPTWRPALQVPGNPAPPSCSNPPLRQPHPTCWCCRTGTRCTPGTCTQRCARHLCRPALRANLWRSLVGCRLHASHRHRCWLPGWCFRIDLLDEGVDWLLRRLQSHKFKLALGQPSTGSIVCIFTQVLLLWR